MACARVTDLLPDYIAGNLLMAPATEVHDHLASCPECDGRLAAVARATVLEPGRLGRWAEALRQEPALESVLTFRADLRQIGHASLAAAGARGGAKTRRQPRDLGWLVLRCALSLETAGSGDAAPEHAEAITKEHPSCPVGWLLLLEALPDDSSDALRLREQLIASASAGPGDSGPMPAAHALARESLTAARHGARKASLTLAEAALELDAASSLPWLARAAAEAGAGRTDSAVAAALETLRASHGYGGLWLSLLGEVLLPLEPADPWRAVRHAEITAAHCPGRSSSWSGLAAAAAPAGQAERAVVCLLRAAVVGGPLSDEDVVWLARASARIARATGRDPRVEEVAGHLPPLVGDCSGAGQRAARNGAYYVAGRSAHRASLESDDGLDLDVGIERESRDLDAAPRRRVTCEEPAVDLVHGAKVREVLQEDGGLHHGRHRGAEMTHEDLHVREDPFRLGADVIQHQFAGLAILAQHTRKEREAVRHGGVAVGGGRFGQLGAVGGLLGHEGLPFADSRGVAGPGWG